MDIRKPKYPEYQEGNLDKNVKYTKELKDAANIFRHIPEPRNVVEKLRSEMWFPNNDITQGDVKVEVDKIEDVRVVKYTNKNQDKKDLIIFFHGGGYFGGSTDTINNSCKYICEQSGATVVSVDYSLAPEFPYPTALNEGFAILNHYEKMYENIYLGGDSAGGGLACSVLIKDIESGLKIAKGLIMYYPVLLIELEDNLREDYVWDIKKYNINENDPDSNIIKSSSLGLKFAMKFIKDKYIKTNVERGDYLVSPINVPDSILEQFPKTLIFTAEFDYLRLEGEYFFDRLQKMGIPSTGIRYAGQTHAFLDLIGHNDQVVDSIHEVAKFIKG